jgi:hypothetical protein
MCIFGSITRYFLRPILTLGVVASDGQDWWDKLCSNAYQDSKTAIITQTLLFHSKFEIRLGPILQRGVSAREPSTSHLK